MAQLGHEIEYLLAATGAAVARRLTPAGADRFASGLGNLVHALWKRRREIARRNLRLAMGTELSEALIQKTVRSVFQNMARSLVEISRFPTLGRDGAKKIIQGDGLQYVEEALSRGHGCIVMTAHFGNWELFGNWFAVMGYPTDILVGVQHNPKVYRMLNQCRQSLGVEIIEANIAARGVLRSLKRNRIVGIAGDQHSHTGLPMEFFGRKAIATRGPALFAVKAGAPIVPFLMRRERYDRHVIMAGTPLYPGGSDDREKDVDDITVAVNKFFEEGIRKYPDQWMWTHRRWKAADATGKEATFR